jgi:16S rRNA processing protein RimM
VSSSTSSTTEWLSAGVVAGPHGLDGSFHVIRPRPELLVLGASVVVAGRDRTITRRAGTDQRPIVRLAGCEDRDAAGQLRGEELRAPRTAAPALEEDEWWAEDLQGCAVHDRGRAVGTVTRLLALPSCEVLEVARDTPDTADTADTAEPGARPLLVPLIRDAVRSVDMERREIDIDLAFLGEE